MRWIPIAELKDDEEIWAGRIVRLCNIGQNAANISGDHLDYLVSYIHNNERLLQLTCLSSGEAGNIICVLEKDFPNHYASGKELKCKIGIENTFINLVVSEIRSS